MAEEVSRDEKLAHFEAATGIVDIDECLVILESCNWNVEEAVKAALDNQPHLNPELQSRAATSASVQQTGTDADWNIQSATLTNSHHFGAFDDPNDASEPRRPKRMLEFAIQYGNRVFTIALSDSETIRTLKEQVYRETAVPLESQVYHCDAFTSPAHLYSSFPPDDVVLATLHLPKYTGCILEERARIANSSSASAVRDSGSSLAIYASTSNRLHRVDSGNRDSTTVSAISSRTTIRNDLPGFNLGRDAGDNPNDRVRTGFTVGSSSIANERNVHNRTGQPQSTADVATDESGDINDDDNDDEQFDAEMDYYEADETGLSNDETTRVRPVAERLMPADITDELAAVEHFVRAYEQRYNVRHPFFVGTLADAIQRSTAGPVDARRPLAIYLHHDLSVFAHLICAEVLGRPTVSNLLRDKFYVVPGDVTVPEQRERIMNILTPHLGTVVTNPYLQAPPNQYPLLIILVRDGGTFNVQRSFSGSNIHTPNVDEFVSHLAAVRCQFDELLAGHREVEMERARREAMRREQDEAYNQSIALDAQRLAAIAEADRARADALATEVEAKRARERRIATARERQLPEPRADEPNCVFVKFCRPDGGALTRRFPRSAQLQALLDYLLVEGFSVPDEFGACYGFPKKFFSLADALKTLGELGFAAQELVRLEPV